ncbi:MAG: hypothetical protein HEP71_06255 [Roseivirga sp.]|nr:hypothetical protein [Roseivirga sp.]
MQTAKPNKELCAWGIAFIMGLVTFLLQPDTLNSPNRTKESEPRLESTQPEKYYTPAPEGELSTAAIVLDNSISE